MIVCGEQIEISLPHGPGSSGEEEPWRYCVSDTESVLGFAVGAMFVREAFDGDSKQEVRH
jgi:predicted metalloendopeptidase